MFFGILNSSIEKERLGRKNDSAYNMIQLIMKSTKAIKRHELKSRLLDC